MSVRRLLSLLLFSVGFIIGACEVSHSFMNPNDVGNEIPPIHASERIDDPNLRCPRMYKGWDVHAEWQVGAGGTIHHLRCVIGDP